MHAMQSSLHPSYEDPLQSLCFSYKLDSSSLYSILSIGRQNKQLTDLSE